MRAEKFLNQLSKLMNAKYIYAIILILIGEVLIIISFLYFGNSLAANILKLDIVVSSIIYFILFIDILVPMLDFKDKSQKNVGSLGIRWFFTGAYMLFAFGAMAIFLFYKPLDFNVQIIVHGILFFLLLIGLFSASVASEKVEEIFFDESQRMNRLAEMKKSIQNLQSRLYQTSNISPEIVTGITNLIEELRFISPSDNPQAIGIETDFLKEINAINDALFEIPINQEKIVARINNCQRICSARKSVFSM
jgi:hypothetical protein